jgi:hypothetical protein
MARVAAGRPDPHVAVEEVVAPRGARKDGGRAGEVRSGGGEIKTRRREKKNRKRKVVGLTFGGENGGPPRIEVGRGNLEGHTKWRYV